MSCLKFLLGVIKCTAPTLLGVIECTPPTLLGVIKCVPPVLLGVIKCVPPTLLCVIKFVPLTVLGVIKFVPPTLLGVFTCVASTLLCVLVFYLHKIETFYAKTQLVFCDHLAGLAVETTYVAIREGALKKKKENDLREKGTRQILPTPSLTFTTLKCKNART